MTILKKVLLFSKMFLLPIALFAFQRDQVVVHEEMIPLRFEDFDCHTSSLVEVSPGVLCIAWKGGPGKGKSNINMKQNVGVWLSFFKDGEWSLPKEIVQSPNSVCKRQF